MEFSLQFESSIRGHHIYKNVWTPSIGGSLSLALESGNSHDRFTVSLVKDERVCWPRQCLVKSLESFSTLCNAMELFLLKSLATAGP